MVRETPSSPRSFSLSLAWLLVAGTPALGCHHASAPSEWPEGSYCVLRFGGSCPRAANGDFAEGTIVIDTDDAGADISSADGTGASSAGMGEHARLQLCCGDFGPTDAIFPEEPFALVAGGSYVDPLCPEGFALGDVFIDAVDESLGADADSTVQGYVGASEVTDAGNIQFETCSHASAGDDVWPDGRYCVFGGAEGCPVDFDEGLLVSDDEDSGNTDELMGDVGGITQAESQTYFPFCCN